MSIGNQIELCSQHYKKWKDLALNSSDRTQEKKFLERAFFWIELQTVFTFLWAIEQTKGKNPEVKKKLIIAKTNLSKKLADYAKEIIDEIKL